jgi:hypothetical protein
MANKTTFELWRITQFFEYGKTVVKPEDMGAVYVTRVEVTAPCIEASVIAMILYDSEFITTMGAHAGGEDDLEMTKLPNGDWRIYHKDSGMLELRLLQ